MTPAGIEPATFRFEAQHLNHCATTVPPIHTHIQDVPGGRCQTSGECSEQTDVRECFLSLSTQTWVFQFCYPKILKIKLYRIIISHAVLYGCEIWSSALREKHRPWVFENRVLTKIPGPMRIQVTEEWKRLYNEELYGLYSIPHII